MCIIRRKCRIDKLTLDLNMAAILHSGFDLNLVRLEDGSRRYFQE